MYEWCGVEHCSAARLLVAFKTIADLCSIIFHSRRFFSLVISFLSFWIISIAENSFSCSPFCWHPLSQ
jgi:hypothetical protein